MKTYIKSTTTRVIKHFSNYHQTNPLKYLAQVSICYYEYSKIVIFGMASIFSFNIWLNIINKSIELGVEENILNQFLIHLKKRNMLMMKSIKNQRKKLIMILKTYKSQWKMIYISFQNMFHILDWTLMKYVFLYLLLFANIKEFLMIIIITKIGFKSSC